MSIFTPETGAGVIDANSYVTEDYADDYFALRNVTEWDDVEDKEAALVQASDYIDLRWGTKFRGSIFSETQGLLYPRLYVGYSVSQYPVNLKKACCEYALIAGQGRLVPVIPYDETGRLYTSKREEVGPIVEETKYSSASSNPAGEFNIYGLADSYMKSFLSYSLGGLVRA